MSLLRGWRVRRTTDEAATTPKTTAPADEAAAAETKRRQFEALCQLRNMVARLRALQQT